MANLNIKDAAPEDIAMWEKIKKSLGDGATSKKVLALLINTQSNGNPTQSTEHTAALAKLAEWETFNAEQLTQYNELVTRVNELVDENRELVTRLEAQCDELVNLYAERVTLNSELETQNAKLVNVYEERTQNTVHGAFICKPTGHLPEVMRKIRSAFYKKGFVKTPDPINYESQLACYSMRYLIENEFGEFLR